MADYFVAQFTDILPKILLVDENNGLSKLIADLLGRHGFRVEIVAAKQLLNQPALRKKFNNEHYYKMIWLAGLTNYEQPPTVLAKMLAARREPLLVICSLTSALAGNSRLASDSRARQQQQLAYFVAINQLLPRASIFLVRDLVVGEQPQHPVFSYICSQIKERRLLDPQTNLFLLSQSGFISQVTNYLLAPYSGRRIFFQPELVSPSKLLRLINGYFPVGLEIVVKPVKILFPQLSVRLEKVDLLGDYNFITLQTLTSMTVPSPCAHQPIPLPKEKKAQRLITTQIICQKLVAPTFNFLTTRTYTAYYTKPQSVQKILIPPAKTPRITQQFLLSSPISISSQPLYPNVIKPLFTRAHRQTTTTTKTTTVKNGQTETVRVKSKSTRKTRRPRAAKSLAAKLSARQRNFIFAAMGSALACLAAYVIFFQPILVNRYYQRQLTNFFVNCQDSSCLTTAPKVGRAPLSFNYVHPQKQFVSDLYQFTNDNRKVNQRLVNYFRAVFQPNSGDPNRELEAIGQAATTAQADLVELQNVFAQQQTELAKVVESSQLAALSSSLDETQTNLSLLTEYLPLLTTLSSQEQLEITLMLLDNGQLRAGGGAVVAVNNLLFNQGSFSDFKINTPAEITEKAAIEIATPTIVTKYPSLTQNGFYNLTFGRSFVQTASMAALVAPKTAADATPLMMSLNLSSLTNLSVLAQSAVVDTDGEEVETAAISNFTSFWSSLANVTTARIPDLFYKFLADLDRQEIGIYSTNKALESQINSLGLSGSLEALRCPTSLASGDCYLDVFAQRLDQLDKNTPPVIESSHQIELTETNTNHVRTVTINNRLGNHAVVEYLSFTLPTDATNVLLRRSGQTLELDGQNGVIITLPAGSSAAFELSFQVPREIKGNNFVYSFYDYRQPGTEASKQSIAVLNTLSYSPKVIIPAAIADNRQVNFLTDPTTSFFGAVAF